MEQGTINTLLAISVAGAFLWIWKYGLPATLGTSLGGVATYAKPLGAIVLVMALVVGLLRFGSTDWMPKRLPYSGSEMFALVWPNLLVVLGAWAILAILIAALGHFNSVGAKVVATMQTIFAVGFIVLIVGGALVALGSWMSSGTSSHSMSVECPNYVSTGTRSCTFSEQWSNAIGPDETIKWVGTVCVDVPDPANFEQRSAGMNLKQYRAKSGRMSARYRLIPGDTCPREL